MPRVREERSPKKMKQVFLVFCEGYTEECYVQELRQRYRSPIKIVPIRQGQDISNALIAREVKKEKVSNRDYIETFLMYDQDVPEFNSKLEKCEGAKICSNPCIEFWFLLHSREQKTGLSSAECVKALQNAASEWLQYKKGMLSLPQKNLLWENRSVAVSRAKSLIEAKNPSTGVYKLLDAVEKSLNR